MPDPAVVKLLSHEQGRTFPESRPADVAKHANGGIPVRSGTVSDHDNPVKPHDEAATTTMTTQTTQPLTHSGTAGMAQENMSHESFATTIEDLTPCTDRSSLATQLPPACQVSTIKAATPLPIEAAAEPP